MKDMFTNEEQQSTNQNKKNKKNLVRITKKAQIMVPICGRRKNSEAKISHAEKDMKNLPRSIQYSLWSVILATLFSVTSGFGSVIHVENMDFVPELGWQFQRLNL